MTNDALKILNGFDDFKEAMQRKRLSSKAAFVAGYRFSQHTQKKEPFGFYWEVVDEKTKTVMTTGFTTRDAPKTEHQPPGFFVSVTELFESTESAVSETVAAAAAVKKGAEIDALKAENERLRADAVSEFVPQVLKRWIFHGPFADVASFNEEGLPSFYSKESFTKFKDGQLSTPCKGKNCGSLNGWLHSAECRAEHEAHYAVPPAAMKGQP